MHSTILHNISPEEIGSMFQELKNNISALELKQASSITEVYLTRQELASMLKCDLSTIHNWTKAGILNSYGIGNRVYYKKTEVEMAILPLNRLKKNISD